ncbi:MAG: cobalamin biosynthesis protein P47K [Planctomycetes bacterium]|nr:cobalamin biosynthesis protein P47K [Planctomycetota bacterium]
MPAPRLVLVGGFLGAGKTTALAALARLLTARGERVGVITNDQAGDLVDTATLAGEDLPVAEIAGACFCCRFDELVAGAGRLLGEHRPGWLLAEAAGSCADLVATVLRPLRRLLPGRFRLAPYSVLIDPFRAGELLGLRPGTLPADVRYLLEQQLGEADLILLTKTDWLSARDQITLQEGIQGHHPFARVLPLSAEDPGTHAEWLVTLGTEPERPGHPLDLDYDRYARAEGALGWANASVAVQAAEPFEFGELVMDLVTLVSGSLAHCNAEIAHVKARCGAGARWARAHATGAGSRPELDEDSDGHARAGLLLLNARAACDAGLLHRLCTDALLSVLAARGATGRILRERHFAPPRPRPTHRDAD